MAFFDRSTNELTAKIVYYGPGLSGKTSNLEYIYENMDESERGRMLSLSTDSDRTILFDFMPLEMGKARGVNVRVQLYTVPGQVFYEETRRKVLKGTDGVVFVADSQRSASQANLDSMAQLREHLKDQGDKPEDLPLVLQYNKRDLKDILSIEELDKALNPGPIPFYEAIATEGVGVEDTLKGISSLVLRKIFSKPLEELGSRAEGQEEFFTEVSEAEESNPWGGENASEDSLFGETGASLLNSDDTGSLELDAPASEAGGDETAESLFDDTDEEKLVSGEELILDEEVLDENKEAPDRKVEELLADPEGTDPGIGLEPTASDRSSEEAVNEKPGKALVLREGEALTLSLEVGGKRCTLSIELHLEK